MVLLVNQYSEWFVFFIGIGFVEMDRENTKLFVYIVIVESCCFLVERFFSFICHERPTDKDHAEKGNGNKNLKENSNIGVLGLFCGFLWWFNVQRIRFYGVLTGFLGLLRSSVLFFLLGLFHICFILIIKITKIQILITT